MILCGTFFLDCKQEMFHGRANRYADGRGDRQYFCYSMCTSSG